MVVIGIIEPVEQSDQVSPMVIQENNSKGEINICVYLHKLNDAYVEDPFPTSFSNEILDNVGGQEAYSFIDGFLGYHQIRISLEDCSKTNFSTQWGSFQYTVMPFGLKNFPAIFSCIVVAVFKEFIHKFLEVYFDNQRFFGLVKNHVSNLHMMLDACMKHKISLNINKCVSCFPFGILLGHVVCQQGLMADPTNIMIIINLAVLTSKKQMFSILGHKNYYKNFIQGYALITTPVEKFLKKNVSFFFDDECQKSFKLLK